MRLLSTSGEAEATDFAHAVFAGPAPDGGLWVPERIEPLSRDTLDRLTRLDRIGVAQVVLRHLIGDEIEPAALDRLVADALDFPIPLSRLGPDSDLLELFHGPTLAFKDVGARFLARILSHLLTRDAPPDSTGDPLTVLVATSGDTGSAVAHAFFGVRGVRVVVLFPSGQISEGQRRLFTTLGGNVISAEVAGTFDDCQRMVKASFADRDLAARHHLASANSINIGRLLPQVTYYFHAWARLCQSGRARRPLLISTPSGNFGNLTAGLLAKRLGLPVERFVAATNVNDVVPRYLQDGEVDPRVSLRTLSNAMDVGNPSNLARIRYLYDDRVDRLRDDLVGFGFTDEQTTEEMRRCDRELGWILDPHTAVGHLGLRRALGEHPGHQGIVLGTAHPAKFVETVELALGRTIDRPAPLSRCFELTEHVVRIADDPSALASLLDEASK